MTDKPRINFTPEQRKEIMTNLYNNQAVIERLITMKMDIHIMNSSEEISPSQKKLTLIWDSIVDAELDVILKTALKLKSPTISSQSSTLPTLKKLIDTKLISPNNRFAKWASTTNAYVISNNKIGTKIELENGSSFVIPPQKYVPILDLLVVRNDSYETRLSEPENQGNYIIAINHSTSYDNFYIFCPKEQRLEEYYYQQTKTASNEYFTEPKQYSKIMPIHCNRCKRVLMFEKSRQPKRLTLPQTFQWNPSEFFNGIERKLGL